MMTTSERDAALSAYAFALCGGSPPLDNGRSPHVSAALIFGAWHRIEPPMNLHTQSDIVAAIERMLSDSPPDSEPAPDSHDPTAERFAAYAEGVGDTLDALGKELREHPGADGWIVTWLAERRASAPKRGMTAADVLDRISTEWSFGKQVSAVIAEIRRELEGATR